jgi:hypothetical protein
MLGFSFLTTVCLKQAEIVHLAPFLLVVCTGCQEIFLQTKYYSSKRQNLKQAITMENQDKISMIPSRIKKYCGKTVKVLTLLHKYGI